MLTGRLESEKQEIALPLESEHPSEGEHWGEKGSEKPNERQREYEFALTFPCL